MRSANLATTLALNAAGEVPEWIELIPAAGHDGMVTGRDGRTWLWDADAHRAVLEAFRERALEVAVDWEHATQRRAVDGGEAPAAGWIDMLEIRDGALWGRAVWTPRARDQIANREYRFLSPVFDYVRDTLRIVRLATVGLVNTPNLHLQALNSETSQEDTMTRSASLTAAIVGALGLQADASDDAIAQGINTLKTDRDTAQAANAETTNLDRYVPRADYDAANARAENAEKALAERDKAAHQAAVDDAIGNALKAGKITPATEGYHRASCSDEAGLERFRAFVAAAPEIGGASGLDGKKPVGSATALNAEQIADKARAWQAEQRKAGIDVSIAAAVRHVTAQES